MPLKYGYYHKWVYYAKAFSVDGKNLKYAFKSKLQADKHKLFGQNDIKDITGDYNGLVYGANYPKPYIAKGITADKENISSFCSGEPSILKDLKAAKYTIINPNPVKNNKSIKSTIYYVTVNNIKYGWRRTLPPAGVTLPTNLDTTIGVKEASDDEVKNLVFGASFPRPPKITNKSIVNGKEIYQTFFCDPAKYAQALEDVSWGPAQQAPEPLTLFDDFAKVIGLGTKGAALDADNANEQKGTDSDQAIKAKSSKGNPAADA